MLTAIGGWFISLSFTGKLLLAIFAVAAFLGFKK